jgi:hypothetical protein
MELLKQSVTLPTSGQTVDYVVADVQAPGGMNTRQIDRYDANGKLIVHGDASSDGIITQFFRGGFGQAAIGAGVGAGLAAQGSAQYTTNTKVNNSNANSPSITGANAVASPTQIQGQIQGQLQGQLQGQAQQATSQAAASASAEAAGGGFVPPGHLP